MTMTGGVATYDDRRRDALDRAFERTLVGGTDAAGTCWVTNARGGAPVVVEFTVFQFKGRYNGTRSVADKLRDPAVLAQVAAAAEAATGQKLVQAPTVTAAHAYLADGSVDTTGYSRPLLDGELAAVVVCSVIGAVFLTALCFALCLYSGLCRRRKLESATAVRGKRAVVVVSNA
jgi:hypothetical protein